MGAYICKIENNMIQGSCLNLVTPYFPCPKRCESPMEPKRKQTLDLKRKKRENNTNNVRVAGARRDGVSILKGGTEGNLFNLFSQKIYDSIPRFLCGFFMKIRRIGVTESMCTAIFLNVDVLSF